MWFLVIGTLLKRPCYVTCLQYASPEETNKISFEEHLGRGWGGSSVGKVLAA